MNKVARVNVSWISAEGSTMVFNPNIQITDEWGLIILVPGKTELLDHFSPTDEN